MSHLQYFKVVEITVPKYWYLMLPVAFLDKFAVDFTDRAVVQCDASVVKIFFVGARNLQVMTNKFWCE